MNGTTIVTGLWDIKRDGLSEGWSRSYEHYLDKFSQLLEIPNNMIIFGDEELKEFYSDIVYNCKYDGKTDIKISLLFEHKSYAPDYPQLQLIKYMIKK